jgi:hypothetical protein
MGSAYLIFECGPSTFAKQQGTVRDMSMDTHQVKFECVDPIIDAPSKKANIYISNEVFGRIVF